MKKIFKKQFLIIYFIIIIVIVAGVIYFKSRNNPAYDTLTVERGNIVQVVSATGRVKPSQSVDLSFEKSGRVGKINASVGEQVEAGDPLIILENSDFIAQLAQARAVYDSENAQLQELKRGTRPEEIQIAKTSLVAAEQDLSDARYKASVDLQSAFDSARSAVQKSAVVAKSSLLTLSDIQYAHFFNSLQDSLNLKNSKALAIEALFGVLDAGSWTSNSISTLSGGLYGEVQSLTDENVEAAVVRILAVLERTRNVLNIVPVNTDLTSTEKTNLSTEKGNISAEIINVSAKNQAILVQRSSNTTAINTAENSLQSARDELALELAGSTSEQISAQQAQVDSSAANIDNIRAQLAKTIIVSPISGIVSRQDAKKGEIVQAGAVLVQVISEADFEIEVNIPEADIAKIKIGNDATVTLDAYGSDVLFMGRIFSVEPAETIIEGVATYKTKIIFLNSDSRIKSGMTANIDVQTAAKENILVLPQKAVFRKNGDQFVQILKGAEGGIENRKVETGLRGSDGNIEILSGLEQGEKVIINSQ